MKTRIADDLSGLGHSGFGHRVVTWWGTLAFMALEGMGFVLAVGVFLYIAWLDPEWPLGYPPQDLLMPSLFTGLLVISLVPNWIVIRLAKAKKNAPLQVLLILMSVIGIASIVIRWFEFTRLSTRWDDNAYGSLLWVILGLHTAHLLTDVVDTMVMTALFFTRHVPESRFSDAHENALYWIFVVVAWLPIYVLLYWSNRIGMG
jgi:heme/copper-type cytochrome/quinol oxidase subunit 3